LTVPPIKTWSEGKLNANQITEIQIEDLLGREEININRAIIAQQMQGKTILVTGAAGSIGSEIVRQLSAYSSRLIFLDQAETPLFHIENEITNKYPQIEKYIEIADVRDKKRLRDIFEKYNIDIVFHAAAYKHVPMMERSPYEAASVNIIGTKNVADLSQEFNVEKFIMISTDKAVNPTNVMGATKRYAEIYIKQLDSQANNKTKFITTRFGNVLGSNGSVIPLFKQQILKGGPLTVTHKDITRYFMTIPEASRLVLEAATMGQGGEIFLFDMGKPVKILDLAERMIKLSGLKPYEDIDIVFSGLRSGEKLYEELLCESENTLPTYHKKIFKAKHQEIDLDLVKTCVEKMQEILKQKSDKQDFEIVANIKQLVKTFKSNNSIYSQLDKADEE
jgi:FlaA1/EpsC-like NDP-sugar epimerase